MDDLQSLALLQKLASFFRFLFFSVEGLLILACVILLILLLRFARALHGAALARKAAGERLGLAEGIIVFFESAFSTLSRFIVHVPVLAALVFGALTLVSVAGTLGRLDEIAKNAQRIKELNAVVRNLEREVTVAEVDILSVNNGKTRMTVRLYEPQSRTKAVSSKDIEVEGTDIYFDAMVLNFDYSEIESGELQNIAIPYRVFSDQVAQKDGILLGALDENGIPLQFKRTDEDIYGIAPQIYRERVAELMRIAADEKEGRENGLVRSLYGSALHRLVRPGDKLELRVLQSGGMVLKERIRF